MSPFRSKTQRKGNPINVYMRNYKQEVLDHGKTKELLTEALQNYRDVMELCDKLAEENKRLKQEIPKWIMK